jgi:hypothetical protein
MEKIWIRDPRWNKLKVRSGIKKNPGSATLDITYGDGSLSRSVKENLKVTDSAVFVPVLKGSTWWFHMLPGLSVTYPDPHKSALFWAVLRSRGAEIKFPPGAGAEITNCGSGSCPFLFTTDFYRKIIMVTEIFLIIVTILVLLTN